MDNKQGQKTTKVASKSFLTVGPTLHYSHKNVLRCWLLAIVAFGISASFWSKILTGSFWSFNLQAAMSLEHWRLGQFAISGVSIFEYPWQILVLGLLMGIMAIVPVLISQLMSLSYSVPFILAVAFLANLPGFAICLLASCFAAACRPLRFRSRFIAIALCTAPQLFYWAYFGGAKGIEPVKWGFSFTPWICAWLAGLAIAGLILGIGHFTRYRPGLVWVFTSVVLVTAIIIFEAKVGSDELDYQLYVAKNNPEQINEFHDHSITQALDDTINNPAVREYLLRGYFYPTEPIALRTELKKEIRLQLSHDRWPSWFITPPELKYQAKKQWLLEQYDLFISRHPESPRMPIALYYKAILSEYSPQGRLLGRKEILHFYNDYPYERSREIWYRLYSQFDNSPESLEARWRIAKHLAGQGRFEQADKLLVQAQSKLAEQVKLFEKEQPQTDTFFSPFRAPAESAMTRPKLVELQIKLNQLRNLISKENRTDNEASAERLAKFVMLNPHSQQFASQVNELLEQMNNQDCLRDNVLLAKAKLLADEQLRAEKLAQLHRKFQATDGGIQALYELARLKINLYQNESNLEQKKRKLADARTSLTSFINLYPDSFYAELARKTLEALPSVE